MAGDLRFVDYPMTRRDETSISDQPCALISTFLRRNRCELLLDL